MHLHQSAERATRQHPFTTKLDILSWCRAASAEARSIRDITETAFFFVLQRPRHNSCALVEGRTRNEDTVRLLADRTISLSPYLPPLKFDPADAKKVHQALTAQHRLSRRAGWGQGKTKKQNETQSRAKAQVPQKPLPKEPHTPSTTLHSELLNSFTPSHLPRLYPCPSEGKARPVVA